MKAMVLCAGYGTRLGDLTRETPKPMLLIEGRPLLEYIIRHLGQQGFDEIAINLHFKPDIVQNYFGDGTKWGVHIVYSIEPELLGTAGGVKKMAELLSQDDAFLVQYGDIITDQDFQTMLKIHQQKQALTTLLLHQRKKSNSIVTVNKDWRITQFLERPKEEEQEGKLSHWVHSGIAICSPQLLEHIPKSQFCDLPRDVYSKIVSSSQLFGYPLSGYRCAVDSPERLAEVRTAIHK